MTQAKEYNLSEELIRALLDNPYESQIVMDQEGMVRYMSSASQDFFGVKAENPLGRHILEVNPNSEMDRVLKTGRAEIGRLYRMGKHERIIARIPLKDQEGRVIGAVAKLMFSHPESIKGLIRQIEILENRLHYYQKELSQLYSRNFSINNIVGESPALQEAKRVARQAAESDLAVLIMGETGTGKELFATAIHQMSPRREGPLIRVNCASVPLELIESELFGYEAGAFTGAARQGKPGKFELADQGTIFLDEIGDMPLPMQAKLLRVLQEKEIERVGGIKTIKLDFRVMAATNRDLETLIKEGRFRLDLYYRLNIFQLRCPALRTIREDIPRLSYALLARIHEGRPQGTPRISAEAMNRLIQHHWPGNIRELKNVLERASAIINNGVIRLEHLPAELQDGPYDFQVTSEGLPTLQETMKQAEARAVKQALDLAGGNRKRAADLLGIHRSNLYIKLKQHGLT